MCSFMFVGKVHVGMGFLEGGPLAQTLGKPTNIIISTHITDSI
jgi:hypothetical protein